MAWIDVLYLTKQKFNNADDLERCIDVARQLDSMRGNADEEDDRIQVLKQFLASEHMLNRETVGRMSSSMQNNSIQSLHKIIDNFYRIIDRYNIEDDKYDEYRFLFIQIMKSDGSFIKTHHEIIDDEDESMFEDEEGNNEYDKEFKSFFDALVDLKKADKNLESILTFFYNSNLTNINIENISDKPVNRFSDIIISYSVIKTICDVKSHKNILKTFFYNAVIKEYTDDANDSKFINNIISKNKNFVDIPDEDSYNGKVDAIHEVYPDSDIAYERLDKILDSQSWLQKNAPEISDAFKTKKIANGNLRTAIKHVVDYYSDNHIMNRIINQGNEADIVEHIDNAISTVLGIYFDIINKTYQDIEEYKNDLNFEFNISNKKLKLKLIEYIKRWKDFLNSDIYKWNASDIDAACQKITDNLFKNNDYSLAPFNSTTKQPVFVKNLNILDIIKNIVTAPNEGHYESIMPYLASFKSPNTSVLDKINVEKMFLKIVKDFISTDYSDKISTLKLASAFGAYYDAICNVIYNKDLNISESLVVEEYMFIYDYVVNEDVDMSAYFDKLAKKIEVVADKDVLKYVDNYAKYPEEDQQEQEEKPIDSSTAATPDAEKREEELKKSAEELKQKLANYGQKTES